MSLRSAPRHVAVAARGGLKPSVPTEERIPMSSTTLNPPVTAPAPQVGDEPTVAPRRFRVSRLWRGPETDPVWARPALLALLLVTAVLYLWGLGASGWANSYYSAAVQAGTKSWKAFFFGSTDAANFITIDKTPASLWPMEISARIFGLSSWSILVPQALMGVAVVGVLYATVKRWFSPGAALVAGAVTALTPVAALMFRFNNPDALLVLLLVGAAYAMTRALEAGKTRWLVLAGVLVGFAFLAKELQAFLVLPGFGLVYLLAGPPKLGRRVMQVIVLGLTTIAAGGWWVLIVQLTPASQRPYIGGSQNNSFWNVLFGYNGFGRLTGSETGSVGGGGIGGQTGQWGPTGWTRLFNDGFGGQASWLLPAALILLVAGLVFTLRRPRTDRARAALILWGSWLLVTGMAISLGQGIIHEYYTVALVPAIGALIGIGGALMWRHRDHWFGRVVLAITLAASAIWASVLLDRTPDWSPALPPVVLILGLGLSVALLVPMGRRLGVVVLGAAIVVALAAPTAYTLSTVRTRHTGALPTAGPAGASRGFGPGRGGPGGGFPNFARGNGGPPGFANGAPPPGFATNGTGGPPAGFGGFRGGAGGLGGLLNGTTVGAKLEAMLRDGSDGYRWTAAAVGANNAASYQLASGEPVMAIGGFNGSDPSPTLAEFQAFVRDAKIHYFLGGGGFGGPGGASGTSSAIATWVTASFTATTVNGATVYDLTAPTNG
jgi:4-amino-4-deoxy-L-arabinose transferase-like glycosyltransferase